MAPRHMENTERAGDGMTAEPREGSATGLQTWVPEETVARVYDAAALADYDDPRSFARAAVESALGVEDPEVDVAGFEHPDATGTVSLSAPDTETARRLAEKQDLETADWVRGTIESAVAQTKQMDKARKQTEDAMQAAMSGARIPAPDPLGVMRSAGLPVRDPLRAAMTTR